MKTNTKAKDYRVDSNVRLAGGYGTLAAKQTNLQALRRLVLANLLWEDNFYVDGKSIVKSICDLVPTVDPVDVANLAVEARYNQKLRHVPLLLVREMARYKSHKYLVGETLSKVINRPDEMTEFLSLYWQDGKRPLAKQVKIGLANAVKKFDEYQLAKWNRKTDIKLRDVLRLVHPKPDNQEQSDLWYRLLNDELAIPETWEVGLSAAKTADEKRQVWENLIHNKKLGGFAFLKNLRNMESVNVPRNVVLEGFRTVNARWLLPLNYLTAARIVPTYERQIEDLMLKDLSQQEKLSGTTVFVVDVSGSMGSITSQYSDFSRLDIASAMTMLAAEMCEDFILYATAGNDPTKVHKTIRLNPKRGFALTETISDSRRDVGFGGIFTRQCLEYIQKDLGGLKPDRIVIFSDSQDCDHLHNRVPNPFGTYNYIIDVSSHQHGINYAGVWTAEISGWSEHFLKYIAMYEQSCTN